MHMNGPFYDPAVEKELTGRWSDRLYRDDFEDMPTCLIGYIFPPALLYQVMERLPHEYRIKAAPFGIQLLAEPYIALAFFFLVGLGVFGIGSFNPVAIYMVYRLNKVVAERYAIKRPGKWWRACLCQVCLLMKLARHTGRAQGFIKYRNE